ncbi:SGNH/GDSL hydrolase family protein [Ensifer adhaerens]|uniref:SGNH/GDSL hydrolase family protein n=1 Tax=Ensifer adhaerens TaxID=106592 RepID=UPI00069D47E3|nr:SGNH/GDSL hydrolase family protein [Ensifer adhaerens]
MVSFVSTIRVGVTRGFTGFNAGVSGQKARDIGNRIDQVLALDFNLIIVDAGTNDRPLGSHPGCTRGSWTTAMSSWPWVNTSAHVAQPLADDRICCSLAS